MVLRETKPDKEHDVHLIFKHLDNYVSLRKFTITLPHTKNFMYKDFINILAAKDPLLKERDRFRMYIRYGRCKFFPIFDFMTMVGAFRMMEDLNLNEFYIIRLDDVYWCGETKDYIPPKFDPMMIYSYYPEFRIAPDMRQLKPTHTPEPNQPLRERYLPKSLQQIEEEMAAFVSGMKK